jgi:hypothetical protein
MHEQKLDLEGISQVILETTSGDIQVRGWDGDTIWVRSPYGVPQINKVDDVWRIRSPQAGSGDLDVHLPRGVQVGVFTASGNLRIADLQGVTRVRSMSGDVFARAICGELGVRAVSGDVRVLSSELSTATIETVSGDCTVETPLHDEGVYRLRSVSGNLLLRIPEEQGCTIQHQSLSGRFRCGMEHQIRPEGWGKQQVMIRGGGVAVRIRTTSGDVSIQPIVAKDAPADEAPFDAEPPPAHTQEIYDEVAEPFELDEAAPPPDEPADERMQILKAIEDGKLSVADGLAKLRALG